MRNNEAEVSKLSASTDVLVFGAGLAGLTAAYCLTKSNHKVIVIEKNLHPGGLARTIIDGEFRFDIGGHRFLTHDPVIDAFVKTLLSGDYLVVPRSSKILLKNKYFQYPLKPLNSIFGMGVGKSIQIILDYFYHRIKRQFNKRELHTLEEWVTQQFGRTMYSLYFKDYSEKVWGIDCKHIAKEWIAQRIQGLSLGAAIKAAVSRKTDKQYTTLIDNFIYPHLGIGGIADKLADGVTDANTLLTQTSLIRLNHENNRIKSAVVQVGDRNQIIEAEEFVSSIPLTFLVKSLYPRAPEPILQATQQLRFRDLIVVTIMLDQERVTDQTWIYFPDKAIPFGRIHEPTNWSAKMAPPGKTSLVAEYFSFQNDALWNNDDAQLIELTVSHLEKLALIKRQNVIKGKVLRIPNAYPLFEVGFHQRCATICRYLDQFENLSVSGRSGMFRYYNMDHTIESGMSVAQRISRKIVPSMADESIAKTTEGAIP